jgi:hypothetical protein
VTSRLIRFRYPASCIECGDAITPGSHAWWESGSKHATCTRCHDDGPTNLVTRSEQEPMNPSKHSDSVGQLALGVPGASAQRKFDRLHQRREQVLDDRFGRLSGVVKFLFADPQSTRAWAVGSEGERLLAERLENLVGDRAVILHDRRVPGKTSNIDHVAVAASGVWVIDAKKYKGIVCQRNKGGLFKLDNRLYVGGRDRTHLADGVQRQIELVRAVLGDVGVPITGSWDLTGVST